MSRYRLFATILVLGCAFLTGCSSNVKLKGQVTFSDDGSPLTCGTVLFDNGTIVARGPVESDGSYTVGVDKAGDGIPPGTYRVSIVDAAEEIPGDSEYVAPSYKKLIDQKYFLADTSGLEVTVDSSTEDYDIKVERPKGPSK